jgi:hypothetical protein
MLSILLVLGCGKQTPKAEEFFGDWIRGTGQREFDGRYTGEDFAFRLSKDFTYKILCRGYTDQYNESFYQCYGNNESIGSGLWGLYDDRIAFIDSGAKQPKWAGPTFQIKSINRNKMVLSRLREGLRDVTYYRIDYEKLKESSSK